MSPRHLIRHLRFKPFPTNTEAGRTAERYRLAFWAMLANLANRALSLALLVVSVSWTIPYLGQERFGLWMTIASFAGMLSFLDLGIGNALTNRVAQAATDESKDTLRRVIGGGLAWLFVISGVIGAILLVSVKTMPWANWLKLQSTALALEAEETLTVFSVVFAVNIVGAGVARIFHGLQRGFEAYLVNCVGLIAGCIALYLAVETRGGLPLLLACSFGGPLLGNFLLFIMLLARGQISFRGMRKGIYSEPSYIFRVGGLFLVLQVGTSVGWGADSFIISSALGPAAVAAYAVTQRLMQFITIPTSILNAPFWAAYADAYARRDKAFIRSTLVKSVAVSFTYSAAIAILLMVSGGYIVDKWTSGKVLVPFALIIIFSIWAVVDSVGNALAMFLNGVGIVKEQLYVVCAFVLLAMPLKLLAVEHLGGTGVIAAGLVTYLLVNGIGYGIAFQEVIKLRVS